MVAIRTHRLLIWAIVGVAGLLASRVSTLL